MQMIYRYVGNMLSSHTRFSEKQVILLWKVRSVSECLSLFWSVPPNSISPPQVASWWKTLLIAAMEASEQTGSDVTDSTRPKNAIPINQ